MRCLFHSCAVGVPSASLPRALCGLPKPCPLPLWAVPWLCPGCVCVVAGVQAPGRRGEAWGVDAQDHVHRGPEAQQHALLPGEHEP